MNKSRLLFFASLILLLIGNIFASDANLVLEWKFDNNDNQLIAQDSSGNSFDGQINNGTWIRRNAGHAIEWADEPGEGITCLYSNGSILDIKKQVSVEVKVKLYEYPASGYTVIASGGGWQIRVTDADFRVAIQVEGDDWPIARWNFRKIPLNEWVRIGFSWDENEGILCLYMNGVMEKEYSLFQNVTLRDLDPSGDYGNYGIRVRPKGAAWSQFSGAIDDFRIWEGIRTDWIDCWEPPTEVNNLNIDRTDDGAVLTWEKAYCVDGTDAASYNIYRYSPGNNEERELISSVTGFTALDPDCGRKKWNYAVTALDQYGNEGAETVVLLPGIGSIRGRIGCLEEGSLVVLDNVLVQIDNRSSLTDSEGYYFLEDILEGDYVVIFRKGGFHSAERVLSVSAEQDLTLDVTMERRDLGEADLVLEWKFDNRDNEIIAQDSSGNSFGGQINNGTWTRRNAGHAIEWADEPGEGITCLYSEGSKLNIKEQVSVEVRFKLNEFPTKNYSVIAAGGGWQIRVKNNGELSIAIQVEGSPIARGQGNIPLNEWVRVGFTMDGVNALLRVYINGIMQREFQMFADKSPPRYLDPSGVYGNYGIRIRPEGAAWSQFSGAIDDLRIWDGIRTDWKDYWEPPTVVKNLNIDRTDSGAVLKWEKAYCADGTDAASYNIYRYSPGNNEERELITNVTGFTALNPDCGRKKWYYAVTALDQYGNEGAETIVLLPGIGSIQGTIGYLDGEQWIAIEHVQVKIGELTCLSNSEGQYLLENIVEGDYIVTFNKSGFKTNEIEVSLGADQDLFLELTMDRIIAEPKLVLEWKFDDKANQTIVQDSSENAFNGQINNGTWIRRNAGHAIEWTDESGEGITCLYSEESKLDIKEQVSVEVRVKLNEYPTSGYTTIAVGRGWQIRVYNNGDLRIAIQIEGTSPIATPPGYTIPLNEWVRIGFAWDGIDALAKVYINGVMVRERTIFDDKPSPRYLDPSGDYGNYGIRIRPESIAWSQFNGAIDDFRIWEGIRTDWIDYWEPPAEVNNLNIDRTDDGAVLTWEKAYCADGTDAASYNIYRYSPVNNEERELISNVTGFTALDPDCGRKSWNYAVTALDQYGNEGAETVVLFSGIGSIQGRIGCLEEGSWVVLDNVLVQVDNRSSLTDSEGYYLLEDILEGDYVVVFRKGGFHSAERVLSVNAEQDLTLDVTMEKRDLGETDLVLEWKFDNKDNEIIAQDSSGNGFDGQINNGTWTSRKTGYAIEWTNESGEGITYLYSEGSKLDVKEQVSVEVRFKLNEYPTAYTVVAVGRGWQIRVRDTGQFQLAVRIEGDDYPIARTTETAISLNEWVRLGFTWDGIDATLRMYINGVKEREYSIFANIPPPRYLDPSGDYGNYGIRVRPKGTAWSQFSGAIDDLRIWEGIRTDWIDYWEPPTEVKNLNIDRTDEGAVLTWEKAYCADGSDAASYKIYRYSPDDNEKRELISNVTGFTALDPDCGRKKWYYAVTALDQYGNEGAETIVLLPGIGSIQGTIGYLDGEQWIAIENVQVKIEDLVCLTNSDGYYVFKDVLEGDYTITFKKAGFYSIEKVSWVRANQDDTLDILMEICDTYPLPPEDFGVEIGDRGEVILRFNMTSGNAYGIDIPSRYLIYRAKEKAALFDETSKIDDVVGCESVPKEYQIIDIPPESGVLYYYAICSENEALLMTRGEIIEMNVPLLPIPSPTLPNNHQIIFDQNIVLEWESEIGYDSYIIELSSSSNFKPEETNNIPAINKKVEILDNLSQGIWYWRVKGLFSNMASSRFSDYYSFNLVLSSDEQIGPVPLFETDLKIVNIREENEVRIKWVSLEEMDVEVRIYTLDNKLVYQYTQKATPGLTELVWKFKGESLRAVRPGLHLVMFKGIGPDKKQIAVTRRLLFLN